MKPDYERSASLAQRVKDAYTETQVDPHWFGDNQRFWYNRKTGPRKRSFIVVEAKDGTSRPAFDHEKLARVLKERNINTDADLDANNLPFTWIDPSDDLESIKFRHANKIWQFKQDGRLTEYDGDFYEETLTPLRRDRPTRRNQGKTTAITFVNNTKRKLSVNWIDFKGDVKHYVNISAGESNRRPTFTGHVWRVTDVDCETPIASFEARDEECFAYVEEHMLDSVTEAFDRDAEKAIGRDETLPTDHVTEPADSEARRVFIRDYNVWFRTAHNGKEIPISKDGTKENPFDENKIYLSPDRKYVVVNQYIPEIDHRLYHIESSPNDQIQPRLRETHYLKPGEQHRVDRPRMFNLSASNEAEIVIDNSLFCKPFSIRNCGWTDDSHEYQFEYNERGHQVLRIVGMKIDGSVRTIVENTSNTFVDYSSKHDGGHPVKDGKEIIWASERDGWNHLYLVDDVAGGVKNQITKGGWVVRSVDNINETDRQVYVKALGIVPGHDPYYAHLARVNLDGSNLTVLTEGDGTHEWKWSPDKRYLVDTWSQVDKPPTSVLVDASNGRQIKTLEENNMNALVKAGWTVPERFSTPGRDGKTLIYGTITYPSHLSQTQKYPIIEDIYAGPTDFSVPKSFSTYIKTHEQAELGFIVLQIDGMGTNWRHKAFHDVCYKNLSDAGLPDRIAWIKAAASTRPWMDLTKVGICGGSAGGANALAALLHYGDFYKVAVADSGCHDNRMDKLWWNEQWMGYPVDESYAQNSNVTHAHKLGGKLLLMVGELDDNVDPSSTLQVVKALNEAGKDYELLFMPGMGHCVRDESAYARRRERDFFVRHLMGVEPPDRNGEGV